VSLPIPLPEDRGELRLSDADRDVASEFLRRHFAEGRLTLDEMEDRLAVVYSAKTGADLAGIFDDLPAETAVEPATSSGPPVRPRPPSRALADQLRVYLLVNALMVAIWLMSGGGYFWPIWVIVPWGFAMAVKVTGSRRRE
jgi:hypothetical protein